MSNDHLEWSAPGAGQRGVALVLVLWMITLLVVIAGSFAYSARTGMLQINQLVITGHLRALADAGIHRGLYEILSQENNPDSWKPNGAVYRFRLDGVEIAVTMRDESAKIDLNAASDALLLGLIRSAGLDEDGANRLMDAILDWRDEDEMPRPLGAEREQYEAAGLKYYPTNHAFRNLEELRLVMGMTTNLYTQLAPALTVFSRQSGINSAIAGREVLRALPNVTSADVDAYIERRKELLDKNLQPTPFPLGMGFDSTSPSNVYNIQSVATMPDGALFARESVIRKTQERSAPYVFLRWQETLYPITDR